MIFGRSVNWTHTLGARAFAVKHKCQGNLSMVYYLKKEKESYTGTSKICRDVLCWTLDTQHKELHLKVITTCVRNKANS